MILEKNPFASLVLLLYTLLFIDHPGTAQCLEGERKTNGEIKQEDVWREKINSVYFSDSRNVCLCVRTVMSGIM